VQYKHIGIKNVRERGQRGVHYDEGWGDLYEMVRKFGFFDGMTDDGFPFLTSYKGPNLKRNGGGGDGCGGGGRGTKTSKNEEKEDRREQEQQVGRCRLTFTVMKGSPDTHRKLVSLIPEDVPTNTWKKCWMIHATISLLPKCKTRRN